MSARLIRIAGLVLLVSPLAAFIGYRLALAIVDDPAMALRSALLFVGVVVWFVGSLVLLCWADAIDERREWERHVGPEPRKPSMRALPKQEAK